MGTLFCLSLVLILFLIILSSIIVAPFILSVFISVAFAIFVPFLSISSVRHLGFFRCPDQSHVPHLQVVLPCQCTDKWFRDEMDVPLEVQCSSSSQEN